MFESEKISSSRYFSMVAAKYNWQVQNKQSDLTEISSFWNLTIFLKFFLICFTAYIVCVYQEPIVPEQAASVTEKLGEYLIQVGF